MKSISILLLLAVALATGCARKERPVTQVRLRSGGTVKVLSIGQMRFGAGDPAILLKYETSLPMSNRDRLASEADTIWADFRERADRENYNNAILAATSPGTGTFISTSASYNFVYQRDAAGNWHRLPIH